jgi:hypothetical protein
MKSECSNVIIGSLNWLINKLDKLNFRKNLNKLVIIFKR